LFVRRAHLYPLVIASCILTGGNPVSDIRMLVPAPADSVSYESNRTVILSTAGDSDLTISTQWKIEKSVDVSTKEAKLDFPKTFLGLIPPKATIQRLDYTFRVFAGYTPPESLLYAYADTATVYSLWKNPAFARMSQELQSTNISSVILTVRGWRDSVCSTPYEDPATEGRSLFKLQVRLVPGRNDVYFSTGGRSAPFVYTTDFVNEFVSTSDRSSRFHGSTLAGECATCHSGLTSADSTEPPNGECVTCHSGMKAGSFLHGPTEMDECRSCHDRSTETNAVIVGKGVPGACAECHEEKVNAAENSTVPHAVASECLTCHSPHSSDREHLLKKDVFSLCTGCHTGYGLNHPVGKHPVRFSVIPGTNEEISCVSCHDPHGSENRALLKAAGGRMAICLQCHQK
jgi:predicted CXXCH cytochrome family protein